MRTVKWIGRNAEARFLQMTEAVTNKGIRCLHYYKACVKKGKVQTTVILDGP